jgi:adenylate cyclase
LDTAAEWTFAFVDLAGFTALTEAHGDESAVDQVARFFDLVRVSISGSSHLVKQIGDAVLIASDESEDAVTTVASLMTVVDQEANFPLIRAGLHTGTAVRSTNRGSADYLGSGVNIAARATAQARGRQVLLTETAVRPLDQSKWPLRRLGPTHFRNVPVPIEMFELIIHGDQDGEVDPVCRMRVPPGGVMAFLRHGDHEYVFCSIDCVGAFASHPDRYIGSEGDESGR